MIRLWKVTATPLISFFVIIVSVSTVPIGAFTPGARICLTTIKSRPKPVYSGHQKEGDLCGAFCSPLFRQYDIGRKRIQPTSSSVPLRAPVIAKNRSTRRTLRSGALGLLWMRLSTRAAWASANSITPSLARKSVLFRAALSLLVFILAVTNLVEARAVQKRQALDATSEWGRYAARPAARGRAIVMILMRMLPFSLRNKLCRNAAVKSQLRAGSGRLFADSLLKLGPLYIKLGQIVSCQEDLLSQEWVDAMERLQDRVPAKSGQEALDLAYSAIGSKDRFDQVFERFEDKPLAAASLGQVHKAVLRENGDKVAVKLQRPFLRTIYDQDLALLTKIARVADRFMGARGGVGGVSQSWTEIFTNAKEILYREIDYRDEADNAIRFNKDFGLGIGGTEATPVARSKDGELLASAASWLRAPYVYGELTTEKVLVMELVPSIKITDMAKLKAANVTMEDKEYLADCLARTYLRSFCTNRFFSTDPHPGNLGVEIMPSGKRPRLVMYDFGQACALQKDQSDGILDVIEAIIDLDADRCVAAFEKMGVLKEDSDLDLIRAKVKDNFATGKIKVNRRKLKKSRRRHEQKHPTSTRSSFDGVTPNGASPNGESNVETDAKETTRDAPKDSEVTKFFTLPAEYAFVARALTQMDGVGKALDPDFDFISSAAPHIVEIKGAKDYLRDEFEKWRRNMWQQLQSSVKVS